ncbi:MAG TPA: drug:proton antiporter, partial [Paraburkholderia sp.]|nr:drug:proton antiporter [Paraburkholderia sp.]
MTEPLSPSSPSQQAEIEWRWKAFDDLSTAEVYDMLSARSAVFVVEQ